MKALKYILFALGLLLLVAIGMGLAGPKSFHINRSIVISSGINQVWPYVSSAEKMQLWSPWVGKDSTLQISYFGEDGAVGSGYRWEGDMLGKGEQTISMLAAPNSVRSDLKIEMPFGAQMSSTYIDLKDTLRATKVTWGMRGDNNFAGRIFGLIMNFDDEIGADYTQGLINLKKEVEAITDTVVYQINTGYFPGGQYLGIRGKVPFAEIIPFYDFNLTNLLQLVDFEAAKMEGAPMAMFYDNDVEKGTADMVVAITYPSGIKTIPVEVETISLPAAYYVTTDYIGGHHGVRRAHVAIEAYLKDNHATIAPPILEVYMSDGKNETDSTKFLTKVVYFVK